MSGAARVIQLDDGAWSIDVLGIAFIHDPDTEEGARFVAEELNKKIDAYVAEQTAAAEACLIASIVSKDMEQVAPSFRAAVDQTCEEIITRLIAAGAPKPKR